MCALKIRNLSVHALAFFALAGCALKPGPIASIISDLTVHNTESGQSAEHLYRLANLGTFSGRHPYVDSALTFSSPIPPSIQGATYIQLTGLEANAAISPSFVVNVSSTVYVAHDTRIIVKPQWLISNFSDTGQRILIGTRALELYSDVAAAGTRVVLGSNVASGGEVGVLMYLIFAVPSPPQNRPPTAPSALEAQCATASVVGLQWLESRAVGGLAGYKISRDGQVIRTIGSTVFADTTVAASTRYSYSITAVDASGNTASSGPLEIITPAGSVNGDAPYCKSSVIRSVNWKWASGLTQPNGSDLWPVTWGADGNVYTFFGDGGGFGGDDRRGRASFGIAMIEGSPPPTASTVTNIYGGYASHYFSRINGKASSIIAIGPDFFAVAGIYRHADWNSKRSRRVSGAPNHKEIAYSLGNAHSWRDTSWSFCRADEISKSPHPSESRARAFCPIGFVNFGRANGGARDEFVYIFGTDAATYWNEGPKTPPVHTYLARVAKTRLRVHSAYQYFSGLDGRGDPIWHADVEEMQPIFTDRNGNEAGCGGQCSRASALEEAVYNSGLKRYIGVAQADYLAQTSFYDAPQIWGPWTLISYNAIDTTTGLGGWGNLGTAAGDALGAHFVNAWTSADGQTMWATFSSNGIAPIEALFPAPGTAMDSFNLLSVRLSLSTEP
jgi:hypothetical protein